MGETGTAALADRGLVVVRSANRVGVEGAGGLAAALRRRLRVEFQEWITAVTAAGATGRALDGRRRQVAAIAGVARCSGGERVRSSSVTSPLSSADSDQARTPRKGDHEVALDP